MTAAAQQLTLWAGGDWSGCDELLVGLAGKAVFTTELADADVVVLAHRDEQFPFELVAAVRAYSPAPVVLLAAKPSATLLRDAATSRVADVALLPQTAEGVLFACEKAVQLGGAAAAPGGVPVLARQPEPSRVMMVFSPKGGTGKSTAATNLALSLASSGRRTLLLDLDLQFGDTAIMLGLQATHTIRDVVTAPGKLDVEKLTAYAVRHESGLHVLPAPLKPEDADLVTEAKIDEILTVAKLAYDAVVIDTAPLLHESVLAALDRTDDLLLIVAPDVPTLKNVKVALQTLELLAYPSEQIRVVLNRSTARVGFKAAEVAAVLDHAVDFELPEDDMVGIGNNRGTPAVAYKPHAPYAVAMAKLANGLYGKAEVEVAKPAQRRRLLKLARAAA